MLDYILYFLVYASYSAMIINFVLVILFPFGKLAFKRYKRVPGYQPGFSLIVPAYNEELVIERTIKHFIETIYPDDKKELVVVNDGSTDDTFKIVHRYAGIIIDSETGEKLMNPKGRKNIILVNRRRGGFGKSYVSNDGIKYSSKEILSFIDADVSVCPNYFNLAGEHFADPKVSGLAGKIFLRNKKNLLQGFIDFEYVTAQEVSRRAFNLLGVHYIVPGGCAFFRRDVIEVVGGYDHGTLAEDTALTWKVYMKKGSVVHYDPRLLVYADESSNLIDIWNQRVRWARGNLQVTLKYLKNIGKRKYGKFMSVYYPFWLVMIVMPIVFVVNSASIYMTYFAGLNIVQSEVLKYMFISYFFIIWIAGIFLGGKRSWFEGFISPGVPLLINLLAFIFWENGLSDMLAFFGLWGYSNIIVMLLSGWIFMSIPGIMISLRIYRKNKRIGNFLVFGIFGYWMFILTAAIRAYIKEAIGEKNEWIHSKRV